MDPAYGLTVARDGVQVTKSDTTVYDPPLKGLWVGDAGAVRVITPSGSDLLFSAVPAGTLLPIQAKQVMATNTVATLFVGLK